jgi:hypothetical protein
MLLSQINQITDYMDSGSSFSQGESVFFGTALHQELSFYTHPHQNFPNKEALLFHSR